MFLYRQLTDFFFPGSARKWEQCDVPCALDFAGNRPLVPGAGASLPPGSNFAFLGSQLPQ